MMCAMKTHQKQRTSLRARWSQSWNGDATVGDRFLGAWRFQELRLEDMGLAQSTRTGLLPLGLVQKSSVNTSMLSQSHVSFSDRSRMRLIHLNHVSMFIRLFL